jgi:phage terminase large subunit GpA-like protein
MRRFAEDEIVIPDGPHKGRRFRCDRNPSAGVLLDAIDSGLYRRFATLGCQQSGKTLVGFVTPLFYHLFEVGETVLCGVPSLDIVKDKWRSDILPALEASRYRDYLPSTGEGSKGGDVTSRVDFRHGPTLRFMTGGGDDQSRAAFTTRVLVITEVDGFDRVGASSREGDQVGQLEGRTRAYRGRERIYLECTPSTEDGRIWREYLQGTQSRLALRCPHCRQYVTPEREHLVGWQDAADVIEAAAKARIACPGCGALWDEPDRRAANADALLVHRGQEITPDGKISGPAPKTNTLGFRWSAANNLLVPIGPVAEDEFQAAREPDEEVAERKMRQWVWALPSKPAAIDVHQLDAQLIGRRTGQDPKGRIPTGSVGVTVGIDLGKWLCHWTAIAWRAQGTPHVFEYGRIEVPSAELGAELGIRAALRQFRDEVLAKGWESDERPRGSDMTLVDSGDYTGVAYAFCEESGTRFLPSKGFGAGQDQSRSYREVKTTGSIVVQIGEGYHVVRLEGRQTFLVEVNADYWKSWTHERLQTPVGQPGAMTLHHASSPHEHLGFGKHLTAEKREQIFVAGKGTVTRFRAVHRNNHWLDATCLACVAGHGMGQRLIEAAVAAATSSAAAPEAEEFNPLTSYRRW